jgi:hypothetical protein
VEDRFKKVHDFENSHTLFFLFWLKNLDPYELVIFQIYNNNIPFAVKATEVKNNALDDLG